MTPIHNKHKKQETTDNESSEITRTVKETSPATWTVTSPKTMTNTTALLHIARHRKSPHSLRSKKCQKKPKTLKPSSPAPERSSCAK
jgi:hypothetical protein